MYTDYRILYSTVHNISPTIAKDNYLNLVQIHELISKALILFNCKIIDEKLKITNGDQTYNSRKENKF